MGKRLAGQGSIFEEHAPDRTTKYAYEKHLLLPDGTKKRVVVRGNTHDQCLKKMAAREEELKRAHPDAHRMSMRQLIERWLEHKKHAVKAKTIVEYRQVMEQHVTPRVGHLPVAKFRAMHAQEVISGILAKSTKRRSMRATANNARRYMKQLMRQAERWELVTTNPLRNIEPVSREPVKRGTWSPKDIRKFLEASEGMPEYALFYTALMTGMRVGELIALEWRHVTATTIQVRQTYSKHEPGRVGVPKTAAGARDIPLSPDLRSLLADQRERTGAHRWVFATSEGGMPDPSNIRRAFIRAKSRAGVPSIRFHDMRRIAATFWARKGFTPKLIQRLMGHATHHVAMEVYTDVLREQWDGAYLTLDDLTGGGSGGNPTEADPDATGAGRDESAGRMRDGDGLN